MALGFIKKVFSFGGQEVEQSLPLRPPAGSRSDAV